MNRKLTKSDKFKIFLEMRKDPTSMWYHPEAELLNERQFLINLRDHHPRIHRLLMDALNRTESNLYERRTRI
jgi:hypothetical protein